MSTLPELRRKSLLARSEKHELTLKGLDQPICVYAIAVKEPDSDTTREKALIQSAK